MIQCFLPFWWHLTAAVFYTHWRFLLHKMREFIQKRVYMYIIPISIWYYWCNSLWQHLCGINKLCKNLHRQHIDGHGFGVWGSHVEYFWPNNVNSLKLFSLQCPSFSLIINCHLILAVNEGHLLHMNVSLMVNVQCRIKSIIEVASEIDVTVKIILISFSS